MKNISYFDSVSDVSPKDYDLDRWLMETINPPKELLKKVLKYRETHNSYDKLQIPCVTISATFQKIRNLDNVKQHNNYIVLDIDRHSKKKKSNKCVDMLLVKELFMDHPSCLYCGFSVSGDGVYAIIKLAEHDKLDVYFEHFRDKLNHVGINIDESCKDYTRLRFFSYDSEAYYNPGARSYKIPVKKVFKVPNTVTNDDESKVNALVETLEGAGIDITCDYEDWIKIGSVLNNNFGESGRAYFHRISRMNSDYDSKKCDEKYNQCSKMGLNNIGTIVNLCKHYGLM